MLTSKYFWHCPIYADLKRGELVIKINFDLWLKVYFEKI